MTEDGCLVAASEKAHEREVMTVSDHSPHAHKFIYTSVSLPLLLYQMWSDVPDVRRVRTTAEEEEELAGRDMASVEVSYV